MTEHTRLSTVRRAAARSATLVGVLVGAALGACTEVGTDPDAPVSLAFDSLPAQAVVAGDTMRDVNGAPARLTAHAYNADDDEIAGAAINFVYLPADTTDSLRRAITISDGYVIAGDGAPTTANYRVVAQAGGLQSQPPWTFHVVPRPDAVERPSSNPGDTTLVYITDSTAGVRMQVLHDSTGAPSVPVPGWPVRFDVEYGVSGVADSVKLVSGRSLIDPLVTVTGDDGVATVEFRVFVKPGASTEDSVVIRGTANYRDPATGTPTPLRGSPLRLVVRLHPLPPATP